MLVLAIVVVIILIWLYRRKQGVKKLQTNEVNTSFDSDWTNSKSLQLRSDLQRRNSNVSKNETDFAEEDLGTYLQKPRNLDQPDSVANSGRINYGAFVLYQSPTGGLSSGEIEKQLPVPKSPCQLMKEQQDIRNIDLQRKLFYGGSHNDHKNHACSFDDRSYARFVWESPAPISNYYKSFPEDSAFDPIIPFHL